MSVLHVQLRVLNKMCMADLQCVAISQSCRFPDPPSHMHTQLTVSLYAGKWFS